MLNAFAHNRYSTYYNLQIASIWKQQLHWLPCIEGIKRMEMFMLIKWYLIYNMFIYLFIFTLKNRDLDCFETGIGHGFFFFGRLILYAVQLTMVFNHYAITLVLCYAIVFIIMLVSTAYVILLTVMAISIDHSGSFCW